jgi:hypothetical protein
MDDGPKKMLRASQAARMADVTSARIYQAIAGGEIETVPDMPYVLIYEEEVRRWIERPKDKGGRPRKNGTDRADGRGGQDEDKRAGKDGGGFHA